MRAGPWPCRALALSLLALALPAAGGEAPAAKKLKLSLAGAVERALASAERIGAARAALGRAGAAVGEARAGGLPQLSLDAGFTRTKRELTEADLAFQGLAGSFGGGSELVPERYESLYTAGVQVAQPLFTGGAVTGGVRSARSGHDRAAEALRGARLATIAAAARGYYAALLAGQVYRVRAAGFELARRHYRDMAARRKAGAASKFEVLRAKVAMQNQEARMIDGELAVRRAEVALLREVGAPQDSDLELVTPFEGPRPDLGLAESMAAARRRRSELLQLGHAVRGGEHAVRAARAGYWPTLSAIARWGGQADDDPFSDDNFDESGLLGLELRWNLFDGLLTRSRVAGAKADLAGLRWQRRGLERDVELEVRGALLAVAGARKFIEAQGANVEEASEALRLAEARQRAGAATELDVQDARAQLEEARLNYVRSLYQYAVARLELYRATGQLDRVNWRGAEGSGKK